MPNIQTNTDLPYNSEKTVVEVTIECEYVTTQDNSASEYPAGTYVIVNEELVAVQASNFANMFHVDPILVPDNITSGAASLHSPFRLVDRGFVQITSKNGVCWLMHVKENEVKVYNNQYAGVDGLVLVLLYATGMPFYGFVYDSTLQRWVAINIKGERPAVNLNQDLMCGQMAIIQDNRAVTAIHPMNPQDRYYGPYENTTGIITTIEKVIAGASKFVGVAKLVAGFF